MRDLSRLKSSHWHAIIKTSQGIGWIVLAGLLGATLIAGQWADLQRLHYEQLTSAYAVPSKIVRPKIKVSLPAEVRGLYWTAYTAGSQRQRTALLDYMIKQQLNTVVIDLKTDDGALSFAPSRPELSVYTAKTLSMTDLPELLAELGQKNIYRIARISVMRDNTFASEHPEAALQTQSGKLWLDNTGAHWLDPAAATVADYAHELGLEARHQGFDEVQFDYVRFPSDGRLQDIVYPVFDPARESRPEVMRKFFQKLDSLRERGTTVSYDLFGMTLVSTDDFGIGQRLLDAYPYADFVSPMVYPSHYAWNFKGLGNPAEHPYEVVHYSLEDGVNQLMSEQKLSAEEIRLKLRPWLQDFDLGAEYTAGLIEGQIEAARQSGVSGWLLWNARNVYEPADYTAGLFE